MARTKEFDPEEAVGKAVKVFWSQGYERTSLDDLMQAMGIARQSLYDTFGDKRGLYMRALRRYRDDTLGATRALFAEGVPVKEGFQKLLLGLSRESKEELRQGCLLLSANMEREADDGEIVELLEENQAAVEGIFRAALDRAQSLGEIGAEKDTKALARFFVATVQGMRAMGRVQPKRKALQAVAELALGVLE
jgi:TetR/AcrR family transcriptional repressor of nem operon